MTDPKIREAMDRISKSMKEAIQARTATWHAPRFEVAEPDHHRTEGAVIMPLTDAELRNVLRSHTGRFGSPIARLHATGEITEHTHRALLERAHRLDGTGHCSDADRLRDAAEYVLAVGCRPAVQGWTARP